MTLDELVTQLRSAYGDALRSVVLYGSAVAGEHIAKKSDYNVLVIVNDIPMGRLRELSAVTRAWRESGNAAPMTFTEREWRASADVFPMEYADILERHKPLYGDPPFEGITVDKRDLRLQAEHEALGILLGLRAGVLTAGADAGKQIELMSATLSALMIVFRAVLRLHDRRPPQSYSEVTNEVSSVAGVDTAPVQEVVSHVRGSKAITKDRAGELLASYLRAMEAVVMHISELPHTRE